MRAAKLVRLSLAVTCKLVQVAADVDAAFDVLDTEIYAQAACKNREYATGSLRDDGRAERVAIRIDGRPMLGVWR
jgi:hypothetical protein